MKEKTKMDELEPIKRLSKDLKEAAMRLSDREASFLVDSYYQLQEYRNTPKDQLDSLVKGGEPCQIIDWLTGETKKLEYQIKNSLERYASESPVGQWTMSLYGIGPVISAGLLAYIRVDNKPGWQYAGSIFRLSGLDPTVRWIGREEADK